MKLITKISVALASCVVILVAEYLILGNFDTVFPTYIIGAVVGFALGNYDGRKKK